jgi:hypothetical protein
VKAAVSFKEGKNKRIRCKRSVSAVVIFAMLSGADNKAGEFTFRQSAATSLSNSYGKSSVCPCLQWCGVRQSGGLRGSKLSVIER